MKRIWFGIIPLIILITGCASVGQTTSRSGRMTLDQAIAEAARQIDAEFAVGTKIALLNFSSTSDRFSSYVLDELSANLISSRKLTIVDRAEVDLIRSEFAFQFSGDVADESMQELGRMLGAQSIVSGSLTEIGREHRIAFRVLNVQTATVEMHYRTDITNDARVQALLETGDRTNAAATTPVGGQQAQQTPARTERPRTETNNLSSQWLFHMNFTNLGAGIYLPSPDKHMFELSMEAMKFGVEHKGTGLGVKFSPFKFFGWLGWIDDDKSLHNEAGFSFVNASVHWNILALFGIDGWFFITPFAAYSDAFMVGSEFNRDKSVFAVGLQNGIRGGERRVKYNIFTVETGLRFIDGGDAKFYFGLMYDIAVHALSRRGFFRYQS